MTNQDIKCHHCYSNKFHKNGKYKSVQRYICLDCNRTFTSKGERFFTKQKRDFAVTMYFQNVGIRAISRLVGASPAGVLKWIRKAGSDLRKNLAKISDKMKEENSIPDIIELDEIYTCVKKNSKELSYGLLILGEKVVLFPTTSEKDLKLLKKYTEK